MNSHRPYFLWDYDLTEADVHRLLKEGSETTKIWLLSRIVESAKLDEVWTYISYSDLKRIYPKLKLKKPIKRAWDLALSVWG